MACNKINEIIENFNSFTQKPVKFLNVQTDVKDDIKNLVKSLYDYTKAQENDEKRKKKGALPELIIQDFDEEQIWQEIDLQNSECWDSLIWQVANSMSNKSNLLFPVETPDEPEPMSEQEDNQSDEVVTENEEQSDNVGSNEKPKRQVKKEKFNKSIVDDKFFKLQEMEKFLLNEEKNDGKGKTDGSDEDSINMFEDMGSEESGNEDGNDAMYNDFFDDDENDGVEQPSIDDEHQEEMSEEGDIEESKIPKKKNKKVKFADMYEDSDSNDSEKATEPTNIKTKDEKQSEFEQRQQRLQQCITRLEEKTLKDAPWQLKGEVDATKRPQNSLLQEVVDFDLTTRPAPIITEQTTITLEDIIKQRIKDKAWDDVMKKEKTVDDQLQFRKPEILDHSKSKLSLAQVYETEYLKQKQAISGEEEEKEPESHTQIKEAMSKLFMKLDALCHYHYTPKAPQAEVKIVSNTPAISMEEVAPVATSDAALLAPEEVKKKHRGDLLSKEERTATDKKRARRKKKKFQQKKGGVQKVTDSRNTKKGIESNDKSLKTSKAFFQQLNDDSSSLIKKSKLSNRNKGKGQ